MYKFCKNVMYLAGVAVWSLALFGGFFFARVPETVGYVVQRIEYHVNYTLLFAILAGGFVGGCLFISIGLIMEQLDGTRETQKEYNDIFYDAIKELLNRTESEKAEQTVQE